MGFNVFSDSGQAFYFAFLIVTGVIGLAALILRFVASRVSHRKFGWEDILATAAVAVFLTRTAVGLRALVIINGRNLDLGDDPKSYEAAFKMIFVADMITMLDQTLSKWSVCALYIRIFGVIGNYRKWIYGLAFAQGLCYLGLVIMQPLQCRPINRFWQFWVEGECFPFSWILLILEIPNSLIDFGLVALAMVMIKGIQLQTGSMWKLRVLFGLGSFAGIFGFIKIGLSYQPTSSYTTAVIGLWAAIQSTACIICCCAPVCGKLFAEWGVWSGLTMRNSLNSFMRSMNLGTSTYVEQNNMTETSDKKTKTSTSTDSSHRPQVPRQAWLRPDVESTEFLVTGEHVDRSRDQTFPLGAIQVDRSVDVVQGALPSRQQEPTRHSAGYTFYNT